MTYVKKAPSTHRHKIHPLSHAVGDFYRACLSFPNACDIYWSLYQASQSHQRGKSGKKKS